MKRRSNWSVLVRRAIELHQKIERNKKLHNELNSILEQLVDEDFLSLETPEYRVHLIDNFAEKNVCYRATGVRRHELIFEKKEKRR